MSKYNTQWRDRLHRAFPQAILAKGALKKPLKVGIARDIKERLPDMPMHQITKGLGDYVNGPKYLGQCEPGAVRVDLDGNPAGIVTEREAGFSQERLRFLQDRWNARRQQATVNGDRS